MIGRLRGKPVRSKTGTNTGYSNYYVDTPKKKAPVKKPVPFIYYDFYAFI